MTKDSTEAGDSQPGLQGDKDVEKNPGCPTMDKQHEQKEAPETGSCSVTALSPSLS